MKRVPLLVFIWAMLLTPELWAQVPPINHFQFNLKDKSALDKITRIVSIDNVDGNTVYAFANQKEFQAFKALGIPYTLIDVAKSAKEITMATTVAQMVNWDRYPTYEVYEQLMQNFAATHPDICKLIEIGTLASGRKLLAVKISDNVENNLEPEPNLFYTSSMHGDEVAGYIMMLRLIDYLLTQCSNGSSAEITKLVNNSVIWINPLANPNGTYYGGNQTVAGAMRYNSNMVDLNRNFPDPADGNHPDGNSWQEETILMMAFADSIPISLSANFHSGNEVVNYPWDTWSSLCADDLWWRYVGGNYRNSAQANSPVGYFDGVTNGLTNGNAWYRIAGGRQDYMNYFKHAREVTIEISNEFLYPSSSLNNLWNYNRAALLGYLSEGLNGVQGIITDNHGEPVAGAKVTVLTHDFKNSEVYSQPATGFYARYLKAGNYAFQFTASGFGDVIIPNVAVVDGQQTPIRVFMNRIQPALCLSVDSITKQMFETTTDSSFLLLKNCGNTPLDYTLKFVTDSSPNWISVNKVGNSIPVGATDTLILKYDTYSLVTGTYNSRCEIYYSDTIVLPVRLNLKPLQSVTLNPVQLSYKITTSDSIIDTVWILNKSSETKSLVAVASNTWLLIPDSVLLISPNDSAPLSFHIPKGSLNTGFYSPQIALKGDARAKLPIRITVDTLPMLRLVNETSEKELLVHEDGTDTVFITNVGGGMEQVKISSNVTWLQPDSNSLSVLSGNTAEMLLNLEVNGLTRGDYSGVVTFAGNYDTVFYTIQVSIDSLPELYITNHPIMVAVKEGNVGVDTLNLLNTGGGNLTFEILEPNPKNWLFVEPKQGIIGASDTKSIALVFDARKLSSGDYTTNLLVNGKDVEVNLSVLENPKVGFDKISFVASLSQNQVYADTLVLSNLGSYIAEYSLKIEDEETHTWINLSKTSGTISVGANEPIVLILNPLNLPNGTYRADLEVNTGTKTIMPIVLKVGSVVK